QCPPSRRVAMPELSRNARNLLRRRANGERVEVSAETLEPYRELARAGVMEPVSAFLSGPESVFRFTREGWENREALQRRLTPSAIVRRICRALPLIG